MKSCLIILSFLFSITALAQFSKTQEKWNNKMIAKIEKGDTGAMYQLGSLYIKTQNHSELKQKGFEYLSTCAALGHPGCCYRKGDYFNYMSTDEKSTFTWDSARAYYTIASYYGVPDAMYRLGELYTSGHAANQHNYDPKLQPQDLPQAKYWLEKAVALGYSDAAKKLEEVTLAMDNPFDKAVAASKAGDYAMALKLYNIAADINHDAIASYNAGVLYYNGQGVQKSKDYARWAFEKAGQLGYAKGSNDAAEIWWEGGYGGDAIEWFTKAISQGYEPARESLANVKAQLAYNAAKRAEFSAEYNRKQTEIANKPVNNTATSTKNASNYKPYTPPATDPYASLHASQQKAENAVDNKNNTYKHQ